jgi:hypothetical protein
MYMAPTIARMLPISVHSFMLLVGVIEVIAAVIEEVQVWEDQRPIPGAGTSNNPALAVFRQQLYLVWNGGSFDSNIYWSVFDPVAEQWAARQTIPGVGTDKSPGAAAFEDRLYVAWKGVGDDKNIWWSMFDGNTWANQVRIANVGTTSGPALAAFDSRTAFWWIVLRRWLWSLWARSFRG